MADQVQPNNGRGVSPQSGGDDPASSADQRSSRLKAAGLRRDLLAAVTGADLAAVVRELLALALDRSGSARDRIAAGRLLLEYSAGKPAAASGDQDTGGPRFVFQIGGPVTVAQLADQGDQVAAELPRLLVGGDQGGGISKP